MSTSKPLNTFIQLEGCNPQDLVAVSNQFASLDLDFVQQAPPSLEAKQSTTSDKADWNAIANALGNVYQALCNNECNAALNAMRSIERILAKRGITVQQPAMPTRATTIEEELPIETEFDYGE